MSTPPDKAHVDSARVHLEQAVTDLLPTADVRPPPVTIDTPDAFDRALSTAVAGDVLTLASTFLYPGPVTLRVPVTLQGAVVPEGRMTKDAPLPRFQMGLTVAGDQVTGRGIDVRNTNRLTTIVTVAGADATLDRCRVLGDPEYGGHRGIDFTGTRGTITGCYIDDIFQPAQDTQAIYSDNMGGGLTITDCYLSAAGETIMFGGGDCTVDRIPRTIRITGCTLTKNPAWIVLISPGKHVEQTKCALEFKNAIDVVVSNCVFEYAGTSEGQGCFLVVITPRNQNGRTPWAMVQDVTIADCVGRHAGCGVSIIGDDNLHASGRTTNVTITNLVLEDLDPVRYGGTGRIVYLNRGPVGVTIDGLTASGTKLKSIVYFDEKLPPTKLTLKHITAPAGLPYPYHNVFGETIGSLQQYAPDAVLAP
jgi:hypothetical protein